MKRTALVIASERPTRRLLASTLRPTRWWVGQASCVSEASLFISTIHLNLILIDLAAQNWRDLPIFCSRARQLVNPSTSRIALLANGDDDCRITDEMRQAVDLILRKPFCRRVLVDWISETAPSYRSVQFKRMSW